jgi:hypothetical protein
MKPLTQRWQYAGENKRSPFPSPGRARNFQPESVVVVLGVMYPSVLPQLVDASTQLDLPLPRPGFDTGRQSEDIFFYDPLSSKGNGDEAPLAPKYRKKHIGAGYVNRAEAQKALARDLALLSLRKRG